MRHVDGVAALTLHNITADDSGKYIVMVENQFGMDCHYASLAVEGNWRRLFVLHASLIYTALSIVNAKLFKLSC